MKFDIPIPPVDMRVPRAKRRALGAAIQFTPGPRSARTCAASSSRFAGLERSGAPRAKSRALGRFCNRSGPPSTDYVSQKIVFVKNFERDRRRLCLRVRCPGVRGRQCRVVVEKLLYAFFNLSPILIGQRVSELSPFRIRWPLFPSGPLPRCPIIVFAIRVDSSLLTAHPLPCFIEFCF
jgi:hypothetical protein